MVTVAGADLVFEMQLTTGGAWTNISCDVTTATWRWGASQPMGPLTVSEGGTLRVSVYDPARKFDPANAASPYAANLRVGMPLRVRVASAAAWTGVLQTWGWDHESKVADLNGLDPIGMLSVRAVAGSISIGGAGTTAFQISSLLDSVNWPTGAKRYFPTGTAGWLRGTGSAEGSVLDTMHKIRFAELGVLAARRDGGIAWWNRAGPTPPASSAIINCGGAGLMDIWKALGLGRTRNRVVVTSGYGVFGDSALPTDEQRTVTTSPDFLQFQVVPGTQPTPHEDWAAAVLAALAHPPPVTMLGTIIPRGTQVAQILCAEYGARWTVKVTGQADRLVAVLGQEVTVTPDWIEVDAVTDDVAA